MPQSAPKRSPWLEVTFAMVVVTAAALLAWLPRKDEPLADPSPSLSMPTSPIYGLEPGPCIVHHLENIAIPPTGATPAIHVRMSYPQGDGPYAVIIFVPGPQSYQGVMNWLVDHWVSHGYVVIEHYLPEPRGWPPKPSDGTPPGPKRDYQLEQLATVKAMVDAVPGLIEQIPALQGMVDAQRIGLAGMGMGGHLSLLLGGATATLTEPTQPAPKSSNATSAPVTRGNSTDATSAGTSAPSPTTPTAPPSSPLTTAEASDAHLAPKPEQKLFQDDRLRAVAALWHGFTPGAGVWSMEQQALEMLQVPTLMVSSRSDRHPKTQAQGWRREMFEYAPPGGRYMFSLSSSMPTPTSKPSPATGTTPPNSEATTLRTPTASASSSPSLTAPSSDSAGATPFDPTASERADREARRYQRMTENLRMITTAFFDAYLRDSDTALYFLRSDAIEQQNHMRTRLEKK